MKKTTLIGIIAIALLAGSPPSPVAAADELPPDGTTARNTKKPATMPKRRGNVFLNMVYMSMCSLQKTSRM